MASPSPAAKGPAFRDRTRTGYLVRPLITPVLGVTALFVLWQLIVSVFNIPNYLLVGPVAVMKGIVRDPSYFFSSSEVTLIEAAMGFAAGAVLGVLSALAIFYIPYVHAALYPSLVGLNTIPKVALAPLFVVWFGSGTTSKVVVALLIAFFPILVNTIDGLASVPKELHELAAIHRGSLFQRFRWIDFMYALPGIFTGMKISIAMAVGGAVVGEFIAGRTGLGFVIMEGSALVDLPSMFGAFLILAVMAFILFATVGALERLLLPWASYRDIS